MQILHWSYKKFRFLKTVKNRYLNPDFIFWWSECPWYKKNLTFQNEQQFSKIWRMLHII